jgi:hypothetical protein
MFVSCKITIDIEHGVTIQTTLFRDHTQTLLLHLLLLAQPLDYCPLVQVLTMKYLLLQLWSFQFLLHC